MLGLFLGTLVQSQILSSLPTQLEAELATITAEEQVVRFTTNGPQVLLDGNPIFIKGVCYSPAPIGANPIFEAPYGDYFTGEYLELWKRDLPLIANLGANTIRVYGWNNNADHKMFLDFCAKHNLWVIITFFLGTAKETPINDPHGVLDAFSSQVARYAGHPAILAWSFGNEINGNWNLFLQAFSDKGNCKWNPEDAGAGRGGCFQSTETKGPCADSIACVYKGLFSFLNDAASQAHAVMGKHSHLVITCLADIDHVIERFQAFESYANELDAWGVQLYRGDNFGVADKNFLEQFAHTSTKPLIVSEYGVDSYNDTCGFSKDSVCYNLPTEDGEAQGVHAAWGAKLSLELLSQSSAEGKGSVAGGCIMAWADEQWKTAVNVKGCQGPRWPSPGFDPSQCEYKAHAGCPNQDLSKPALCGYPLAAPFDGYVNEGYWGIVHMLPSRTLGAIDVVRPKLLYAELRRVWLQSPGWVWVVISAGVFSFSILCLTALYLYDRQLHKQPSSPSISESRSFPNSPEPQLP